MAREYFAGVMIVQGSKVLLVQEGHKEAHGLWSFPLGHCDEGESPETAAAREVEEETGLLVHIDGLLSELVLKNREFRSTSAFDGAEIHLHLYHASVNTGVLRPGEDVLNAQWVEKRDVELLPLRGEWMRGVLQATQTVLEV